MPLQRELLFMEIKEKNQCPLCSAKTEYERYDGFILIIKCEICGDFRVEIPILDKFEGLEDVLHLASGITRWAKIDKKKPPFIDCKYVENIKNEPSIPKDVFEKIDKILLYIKNKSSYDGHKIEINSNKDYPIAFAKKKNEMLHYLKAAVNEYKYLEKINMMGEGKGLFNLTTKGDERLNEIKREISKTKQAFVAMWFKDEETGDAWENGFKEALEDLGYKALRIDKKEHINKICDEIFKEIKRSDFLVADLTGLRSGVFFEAGFAKGLNIPVIWTCRGDYFDEAEKQFDTRQYNHIKWENSEDLKEKLIKRIKEAILKKE